MIIKIMQFIKSISALKMLRYTVLTKFQVFILLLICCIYTLIWTNLGAYLACKAIIILTKPPITFSTVTGRLLDGLNFTNVEIYIPQEATKLHIDSCNVRWKLQYNLKEKIVLTKLVLLGINGTAQQHQVTGQIAIIQSTKDHWHVNNSRMQIEDWLLQANTNNKKQLIWHIINPDVLMISGIAKLSNLNISGHVKNLSLYLPEYGIWQLKDIASFTLKYKANGELDGNVLAKIDDFSPIMYWIPQISRLKALASLKIRLQGTLQQPKFSSNLYVNDISVTIPSLGVKIKPAYLNLTSNEFGQIKLLGTGSMRNAPGNFSISGMLDLNTPGMPNYIKISGTDLESVSLPKIQLNVDPQLVFSYNPANNNIDVAGNVYVNKAKIDLSYFSHKLSRTEDVVFVDNLPQQSKKSTFNIMPQIFVRMQDQDNVNLVGYGLDSYLTGKVYISKFNNNFVGSGRVTIKSGAYKVAGKVFEINRGRLSYPPGTYIDNPQLDIKLLEKKQDISAEHNIMYQAAYIQVQGTLLKPNIESSGLSDHGLLFSQIMGTGNNIAGNLAGKLLGETDIRLESGDDQVKTQTEGSQNKNLVVGKKLFKNLYLQYIRGLHSNNNTVKIKYPLGKHVAVGLESIQGEVSEVGADFSFSYDK